MVTSLLSTGFIGLSEEAFAKKKDKKNTTKIIHLGFLQLAAHDFFNMNRCLDSEGNPVTFPCEVKDSENGKLDLSTVLFNPQAGLCDYKKSVEKTDGCSLYPHNPIVIPDPEDSTKTITLHVPAISNGGEKRSVENIMISTASADVGEKYLKFVEKHGEKKAYKKTLKYYHQQIKKAYEESFGLKFPKPKDGEVTNMHNLAVRAGHDLLSAEIVFNGKVTSLFAIPPLGEKLSEKEKRQASSPVDGKFDKEFTGINFCPVPPHFCIKVDLLFADQSFGEQFADASQNLDGDTFDDFMDELKDRKFNKKDKVSIFLDEAFSRGMNLD